MTALAIIGGVVGILIIVGIVAFALLWWFWAQQMRD